MLYGLRLGDILQDAQQGQLLPGDEEASTDKSADLGQCEEHDKQALGGSKHAQQDLMRPAAQRCTDPGRCPVAALHTATLWQDDAGLRLW